MTLFKFLLHYLHFIYYYLVLVLLLYYYILVSLNYVFTSYKKLKRLMGHYDALRHQIGTR